MTLPAAHGGTLIDCYLQDQALAAANGRVASLPRLDLTARQLCDFDLIANGAFSPLDGFLGEADYRSVLADMRLANGTLWPMPITLDVSEAVAESAIAAGGLVLTDAEGVPVGILDAPSAYRPDRREEALQVFGTTDMRHPAVAQFDRAIRSVAQAVLQRILAEVPQDLAKVRDVDADLGPLAVDCDHLEALRRALHRGAELLAEALEPGREIEP